MAVLRAVVAGIAFMSPGFAQDAPTAPPAPAAASGDAEVKDGGEWLAWYLALPRDDLRARIRDYLQTQDAPPFEWLPRIAQALDDPDPDVRALAATAIGSHFDAAAEFAGVLEAHTSDLDARVRFEATYALIRVTQDPERGADAIAVLVSCDDPAVRVDAARLLPALDPSGARVEATFSAALAAERDETVRRSLASYALTWVRRERELGSGGTTLFAPFLEDPDPVVRAHATAATIHVRGTLAGFDQRVLAILEDGSADAALPIVSVLSRQGPSLAAPILARLRVMLIAEDPSVRAEALWALTSANPGHEWQGPLIALSDPDENVRSLAANFLRREDADGPPEVVVPALARAIGDESIAVRQAATLSIVGYGIQARPYAKHIARSLDEDAFMARVSAALYLGNLDAVAPAIVDALERAAAVDSPRAAAPAAWALDALDSRAGAVPKDPRLPDVMAAIDANVTGRVATDELYFSGASATLLDRYVAALLELAKDPRAAVRAGATLELVCLLGHADDRVRAHLAATAQDADAAVRRAAALRLATMMDTEHTDATRAALDALAQDADATVREAAVAPTNH